MTVIGIAYDCHNEDSAAELAIVSRDLFAGFYYAARDDARIRRATSPLDWGRDDTDTIFRLSLDGQSGYAVREDGELVYVFSRCRGRGNRLVSRAVDRDGAVYLDCFDGHLVDLYGRHGFVIVDRVSNWTPGEPDVCYMARPGFADRHGA